MILDIHKYLKKKNDKKIKCLDLLKKVFITAIAFIGLNVYNAMNAIPLKHVSMSNQECRVRQVIMNINSNEHLFYTYSVTVSKCSGSCNDINNPYTLCVPDVVKNMNIKVFNIMSRTPETHHIMT